MSSYRNAIRFFSLAFSLALPITVSAATFDVKALIDTDNNRSTGCNVVTPGGIVSGIDIVLTTAGTVVGGTGNVTAVSRQTCTNPALNLLSVPIALDGTWSVGVNGAGDLLIESHLGLDVITMDNVGSPRFVFTTSSGFFSDVQLTPWSWGGGDIIMPHAARDRAVTPTPPRNIVLDGNGNDWNGVVPLANGTAASPAWRFITSSAYAGLHDLFFNFQIHTNPAAPTAHDDFYALGSLGGTLTVATLGVLNNDNPNGQPITATLIDNPHHGTLALASDGGFTYTHDGSLAQQDQFHYVDTGTPLLSNIATVTIELPGSHPYTFTSADHITFTAGQPNSFQVTVTGKPTPALTEEGALPAGVTFVDNGDGTGTLSGTPAANSVGTYSIVFNAEKNKPHQSSQNFTLTVVCPGVTATITPTPAQVCANSAGNSATGPAGMTTYAWSIVNGTITSATNIQTITYTAGGSGTVGLTLTVTNASGCSATNTVNVPINPTPSAAITPTPAQVCANSTGNTAAGAAGASIYAWSIVNGTITSATNIQTITYTAGGSGTVGLTLGVTNTSGCAASNSISVTINPNPATPTASNGGPYCVGATISLSTPSVVGATYSWTGPNGFTSSLQNPTRTNATLADAGTYSVTVTVTVSGCTSAAGTTNVVVNPTPATPTASNGGPYCPGATISLSTPSVGGATYSWTGPNGFTSSLQNPTRANATTADAGIYSVTVTVSGCTSAAGPTNVVVNPTPATPPASNGGPYCVGATIALSTPTVASATYSWTGPNGFTSSLQNPTRANATTADAGTYSVTVTVSACPSAAGTTNVVVNTIPAMPTASNGGPYCEGATISLSTPAVGGASYSWTGPNGFTSSLQNPTRPSATLADAGTYSVTVTVNSCTSAAGTTNVVVNATPATPTPSNGGPYCEGATISLSTPLVSGATYSWTGPNGFTSSLQNPTRANATTADAGIYSVTVTVNNCISAVGTTSVVVNPIPATPTASNGGPYCEGATISLSTPAVGGATYSWTGPNGFTSSLQNPTRANATLADAGTYSVTVTVNGCPSAAGTTNVVVNTIPATPTASNGGPYCEGATISLSTPAVGGATYSWTGPNGFTSSLQNPTRANATLADAGTYSVTVTVNGCTSAAGTTNVVVNATPATPTPSNGGPYCEGATIALFTPTVASATYSWTGPNGFTSSAQNPTRPSATLADAGTYSVTVTVNGCPSAAGTTDVVVNTIPATPTASNGGPYCVGATISLSTPAVGGATYSWTGPNGFTSSLQNPTRANATLADAGTYSVTVTVNGCPSAAGTTNVVVNTIPATPTASNGGPYCVGATISLSTPAVGGATYSWTGPNGFTSSLQNPTRTNATLADAGTYSVTVTVSGCTSAAGTTNVVVNPTPATPTASNGGPYCVGATISLSTPSVVGATYSWTGPNGFTSSLQNPTRANATLADAGTYSVTVTVNGCPSAAGTTNVVVNTIPATPTASNGGPYCEGATISLSTPAVGGATYSWTGPNGFTSSLQNPTRANATLADAGTYSVTVTVNGCTSAAGTTNVVVNPTPATPTASNGGPYCEGATISLSTPAVGGATYSWTGPNGFSSSLQNPTRANATLADAGTYSVTVTVNGCPSAAGTTNVVVNTIPATPTASNGGPYCIGATITLSTPSVGGATYSWTGPNGFTSSLQNPTRANATLADAGTYSVTVTVNGCTSAAGTTNVVVNATPTTPTASNGGPYCVGATISLSTPAVGGATYSWTGPNGFTSSLQNPTRANATLADAGTYSVTITVNGCSSAAGTTNVVVNPIPATPTASNGGPYCQGATISLSTPTVSGATYAWSGPNGFTSSLQNPTRTNATTADAGTYSVTITVNGCTSSAGTTGVVVNANPATPTITPTPAALCPSSTGNTAAGPVATTWFWSIVNGTITSANTIQTITYTAGASGTTDLTLVVTNAAGCSASNTVNVAISNTPPLVTTHPVSQSVQSGSSVTFTAAASGTPPPTVQWQVSTGGPFTDIIGETNTSLTFTAQLSQNGNQYRAVFTNACGTATTNAAILTVTCPAIAVSRNGGGTFPNGVYNAAYTGQSFTANGPPLVGPYTFAVTGGTFPPGLNLASNGTISGTPTATGAFSFNVTATDTPSGCSSPSTAFSISIAPSAANDTYGAAFNIVDNTQFVVTGGSTSSPGTPFVGNGTLNILTNDSSDAAKTATTGTFGTSGGGSVTIAADGTFIYTPKANPGAAAVTSDSFTYTVVSNGVTSTAATVNLTLANRVWYVKNNGAAGNGQSQSSFNTLAAAQAASLAGDIIFVYNGNNTTSGQNAGITLKNTQQLIGEGVALVVNTVTLVPAGTKPLITNTAGDAVTLANGNTLKGLNVTGPSGNGIAGLNTAGLTMDTMTVQGAGAASSGLVLTTPTGTVTITNTTISNSPFCLTINGGTAATTLGNTNTITANAGQRSINFSNLGATAVVNIGATINDTGNGISVTNSVTGAQVNFTGSQTFNTSTNTAVTLTSNNSATISFSGTLSITVTNFAGFSATGSGTLNVSGTANITTTAGTQGVQLSGIAVGGSGVTFTSVSCTGTTTGISLTNVTGTITVNGGTINNAVSGASLQGASTNLTLANVTIGGTTTTGITNTTNFGTLTIGAGVNVSAATALNLTTGAVSGTFANVSSTGGTNGVNLSAVTGTWGVTAGTLTGATGSTFNATGTSTGTVSWGGAITQANAANVVTISGSHTGTINVSGNVTSSGTSTGLSIGGSSGTYNFNGTNSFSGAGGINIGAGGESGTVTFSNSTTNTVSGDAFVVDGTSGNVTAAVTYSGTIDKATSGSAGFLVKVNKLNSGGGSLTMSHAPAAAGNLKQNFATASGISITNSSSGSISISDASVTFVSTAAGFTGSGNTGTINLNGLALAGSGNKAGMLISGGGTINVSAGAANPSINMTGGTNAAIDGTTTAYTGTLNLNSATITGNGVTAVSLTSSTLGGTASTITNAGPALVLSGVALTNSAGMNNITSSGGTNGISLTNVTGGTYTVGAGSLSGNTGSAFLVSGGSTSFSYAGNITQNTVSQKAVNISGITGGTITLSGAIGSNGGAGISLAGTGGTVTITGQITLNNSSSVFSASGAGLTVNVTNANNTIGATNAVTTAAAVNITNATIGASGVNFKSVSANGPANGIVLNNTGATGGFTIAGDGGGSNNGSGGTIQSTTAEGILLTSTKNVSIGYMNITNPGTDGIGATGVNGLTINRCTLSDNAGNTTIDDGLSLSNTSGALAITNTSITAARHQGITIDNNNTNMASMTITGSSVTNTPGGDGILIQMRGTSVMTTGTIGGAGALANTISGNSATGLQVNNIDTGNITGLTILNNTISSNNGGIDLDVSPPGASLTVTVQSNTITGSNTNAFNLVTATTNTGGSMTATIRSNNIGTAGVFDSGSKIGNGIRVANGGVNTSLTIDSNVIREVPNGRGIDIEAQAYSVQHNEKVKIINNTIARPSGTTANIGCGAGVPCPQASIFILSDSNGLGGFDKVCSAISGNSAYDPTSWPAGGEAAFYFARRTSANNTLQLEGTLANARAQILATNTVTNPGPSPTTSDVIDEATSGTVTIVAAGTCGSFPP